ncbi:hypothetical protein VZT92_026431 [Zoarces viviparus]|uniref:Uncharacterized protein n=1 Tax=Zoarces viviparus TaxID=48416 RepID=A0AAW1E0P5_ZOAVI
MNPPPNHTWPLPGGFFGVKSLNVCRLTLDEELSTIGTVATGVLKTPPTAGRRRHRKLVWCGNQKSKSLPRRGSAVEVQPDSVCRVVVADTLLTQAVLRKGEVGGIAVQQVNM